MIRSRSTICCFCSKFTTQRRAFKTHAKKTISDKNCSISTSRRDARRRYSRFVKARLSVRKRSTWTAIYGSKHWPTSEGKETSVSIRWKWLWKRSRRKISSHPCLFSKYSKRTRICVLGSWRAFCLRIWKIKLAISIVWMTSCGKIWTTLRHTKTKLLKWRVLPGILIKKLVPFAPKNSPCPRFTSCAIIPITSFASNKKESKDARSVWKNSLYCSACGKNTQQIDTIRTALIKVCGRHETNSTWLPNIAAKTSLPALTTQKTKKVKNSPNDRLIENLI